jgi:putative nucleotidyltransferase with HDIG domain
MMIAPAGAAHPRIFAVHLTALLAIAGLALASSTWAPIQPLALAVAFVLMGASEMGAVPLPGGGTVSVGGALDIACLLTLGPFATAWLDLVSTLVAQGLVQRRPFYKVAHNAAAFSLTTLAAGAAFQATGGRVGLLVFPRDLLPLLACGATYFALNSGLAALGLAWSQGGSPRSAWLRAVREGLPYHLSFLGLGACLALAYFEAGPWGLLVCGVPFLVARHAFRLYVEIRNDLKDFVRALSEVLDEVDPYTRQHSVRVATYAVRLARALGCPEREVEDVETAALVHDLGKIGPQNQRILQKAGTLSHEDQRTLRGHPATGAGIVARVRALRRAAQIVRLHHERPDGLGYPLGLRSDQVPQGARILNVADAFDAMTSDRPYRRALSPEAALQELDRGAGTQFDRQVVDCLLSLRAAGAFDLIRSPSSEDLRRGELSPRQVPA